MKKISAMLLVIILTLFLTFPCYAVNDTASPDSSVQAQEDTPEDAESAAVSKESGITNFMNMAFAVIFSIALIVFVVGGTIKRNRYYTGRAIPKFLLRIFKRN
jgi:uncharacterized membrane protein